MANQSGASFDEPVEPAADGEAAASDAPEPAQPATEPAAPVSPEQSPADGGQAQAPADAPAATGDQPADAPAATGDQAAPAAQAAAVDPAGEKLYKAICFACHDAGVAGAAKLGDQAAWGPIIATGMDAMVEVAIHGKGAMPPRGGSQASDAEIRAAVEYMVQQAQ